MRATVVTAVLCLNWVLWATPVHGIWPAALMGSDEITVESAHCAGIQPAGGPSLGDTQGDSGRGSGACLLHCTALAQAAPSQAPAVAPQPLLLVASVPAEMTRAISSGSGSAHSRCAGREPPAPDLLLQSSILRL